MVEESEDAAAEKVPGEIEQQIHHPNDDQPEEHESCAEGQLAYNITAIRKVHFLLGLLRVVILVHNFFELYYYKNSTNLISSSV